MDKFENWMDGTCLVVDEDDRIVDFIPGKLLEYSQKERYYKTVNIYKLSADFPGMCMCRFWKRTPGSWGITSIMKR